MRGMADSARFENVSIMSSLELLLVMLSITYRFADILVAQEVTRAQILLGHQLIVDNSQ